MPVRRYDRATLILDAKNKTPQGFLRVPARLTRTGIFLYRRADGTMRRELRLPEHVFDAASMASFSLAPLTLDHPPEPVTPDNVAKYRVGTVGENIRRDGDYMATTVVIENADAIKAVESGKRELSNGYECVLDETPGEWNGEKYDAIQTAIVANHSAIVQQGRAGPEVRLRMDAADAEQIEPINPEPATPGPLKRGNPMEKIVIDGVECEVSPLAAQLIRKTAKAAQEKHDADEKAHKDALAAADAKLATAQAETKQAKADADTNKGKFDAAEAARIAAEKARTDAVAPEAVAALVAARVEIETKGRAVLGNDAKLAGKTPLAIKKDCLAKLAPEMKLDGKSDDRIEGAFEYAFETFAKQNPAAIARAGVLAPPPKKKDGEEHKDENEDKDPRAEFMAAQNKTDSLPGMRAPDRHAKA